MTEIKRYEWTKPPSHGKEDPNGQWCAWYDVEALIKECDELRAKAFAAVWLLPENISVAELLHLREEARAVFMGKDKQLIAKLQDELRNAQEALHRAVHSRLPGVNAVYVVEHDGRARRALMITKVQHAHNGGLDIEVQLP